MEGLLTQKLRHQHGGGFASIGRGMQRIRMTSGMEWPMHDGAQAMLQPAVQFEWVQARQYFLYPLLGFGAYR